MQRPTRLVITGMMLTIVAAAGPMVAQPQQKDYLSEEEAGKIRDADTPSLRIKLYLTFAEDRLKKFEYEAHRTVPERHRSDILNGLLNGYAGCMDDAADQITVAREKQAGIRDALKLMRAKGAEFLAVLENYDKNGPELDEYRDTLEDAIEGTKDALSDASEAEKEMLPPPVRRKQ
ncbi:MAG TPA: hypothetical protein VNM68_13275 [Candidatus Polarisedimenticolia bacterium]|nr:hypothetical protein [Candidatus Polarisedimenticolia bacterium]